MSKFWSIVKQVYKKNVMTPTFIFSTLIPVILFGVFAVVGMLVGDGFSGKPQIAIVSDDEMYTSVLSEENEQYTVDKQITTEAAAKKAIAKEDIDGYFTVNTSSEEPIVTYFESSDAAKIDMTIVTAQINQVATLQRAERLGISASELASLSVPVTIGTTVLDVKDGKISENENGKDESSFKLLIAMLFSYVCFFFILSYASIIAQEVASEKGTRIMEIILSSVTSTTHFFGKLVAVLLVCFTQIVTYIILGAVALKVFGQMDMAQEILGDINFSEIIFSATFGYGLIFFILGMIIYSVSAAFLGSLVSKAEEVGQVIMPLMIISMVGFYGSMTGMSDPQNSLFKIGSYVPFFSPMLMPYRIATETISTTGIWLSILGTIVFGIVLTYLALMLYRSNVLVYSDSGLFKTMKTSWSVFKNQKRKEA